MQKRKSTQEKVLGKNNAYFKYFHKCKNNDPQKAEAFINALDEAANAPRKVKERGESHILTDHKKIKELMEKRKKREER